MATFPTGKDMDAVADWVVEDLYGPRSLWRREEADYSAAIDEAVAHAERGYFRPLAALVRSDHPWNTRQFSGGITVRDCLAPSVWRLISERLTGRRKAKQGRPPKTEAARRMAPVYRAAIAFGYIEPKLRRAYPKQNARHVHDRALSIAARYQGGQRENIGQLSSEAVEDRSAASPASPHQYPPVNRIYGWVSRALTCDH